MIPAPSLQRIFKHLHEMELHKQEGLSVEDWPRASPRHDAKKPDVERRTENWKKLSARNLHVQAFILPIVIPSLSLRCRYVLKVQLVWSELLSMCSIQSNAFLLVSLSPHISYVVKG